MFSPEKDLAMPHEQIREEGIIKLRTPVPHFLVYQNMVEPIMCSCCCRFFDHVFGLANPRNNHLHGGINVSGEFFGCLGDQVKGSKNDKHFIKG